MFFVDCRMMSGRRMVRVRVRVRVRVLTVDENSQRKGKFSTIFFRWSQYERALKTRGVGRILLLRRKMNFGKRRKKNARQEMESERLNPK